MLLKKFQFWPENIKIETFDFHLWKKTFILDTNKKLLAFGKISGFWKKIIVYEGSMFTTLCTLTYYQRLEYEFFFRFVFVFFKKHNEIMLFSFREKSSVNFA